MAPGCGLELFQALLEVFGVLGTAGTQFRGWFRHPRVLGSLGTAPEGPWGHQGRGDPVPGVSSGCFLKIPCPEEPPSSEREPLTASPPPPSAPAVDEEFEVVSAQLLKRTQAMLNKYRLLLLEESRVRLGGLRTRQTTLGASGRLLTGVGGGPAGPGAAPDPSRGCWGAATPPRGDGSSAGWGVEAARPHLSPVSTAGPAPAPSSDESSPFFLPPPFFSLSPLPFFPSPRPPRRGSAPRRRW